MKTQTLLPILGSAVAALVLSGCLVSTSAKGTVRTKNTTSKPRPATPTNTTPNTRPVPVPRGGTGGIVRDWRSGHLGGAAKFMIEPSMGPVGTIVNLYGVFRPAVRGGAVTCSFTGSQAVSPYFVSLRRMIVRVPQDAKSGAISCKVGRETLFSGAFTVAAELSDIFVPTDEVQGVLGAVYQVPAGTRRVPDFSKLGDPIGTFVVPTIHTSPRKFERGFPGVNTKSGSVREWYAIRYVGLIDVTREAEHAFKLKNSDGAKLYIDNKLVIDNDGVHPPIEKEGSMMLSKGKHRIVVEYFKSAGAEIALELWWKRGVNPYSGVAKHSLSRYSVEYDCSVQPVAVMCCKAMTPTCQMCAGRQRAGMDAWNSQCRRP